MPQDADVFPVILRASYENLAMIALFQVAATAKNPIRPLRKFTQSSTPKWVPVNKSFVALIKIILSSAVSRLGVAQAGVTLRCLNHQGYRHLLLAEDVNDLFVAASGGAEEFIISTQEANATPFPNFDAAAAVTLPVDFATPDGEPQRLGYLVVQLVFGTSPDEERLVQELKRVVEEIVRVISRYQSRYRSIHWYGDQSFWIGNSAVLRHLDQQIDRLAKRMSPVLIRGDKGTGKIIAARRLHDLGCSAAAPFIESDCREWELGSAAVVLESLWSYATGGSLFLRNVDCLSPKDKLTLRHFCLQWLAPSREGANLRLVFSLTSATRDLVHAELGWMVNFVQALYLPTLRERREDLQDLVQFFVGELAPAQPPEWHDSVWAALAAHVFPTHVDGLKALVRRLVLELPGGLITAERLRSYL